VSGSVWFRPEQISAVTDPGLEHFWPDCMNATYCCSGLWNSLPPHTRAVLLLTFRQETSLNLSVSRVAKTVGKQLLQYLQQFLVYIVNCHCNCLQYTQGKWWETL